MFLQRISASRRSVCYLRVRQHRHNLYIWLGKWIKRLYLIRFCPVWHTLILRSAFVIVYFTTHTCIVSPQGVWCWRAVKNIKENKMRNRAIARAVIIATSCIAIAPYRTRRMHLVHVAVIFIYSRTAQTDSVQIESLAMHIGKLNARTINTASIFLNTQCRRGYLRERK